MDLLNRIVGRFFDGLLYPLRGLPPLVSLAVVSLLFAVFVLWVFRVTSNQKALATAKRRMQAGLYEIRLFNDDPRFILRSVGSILRHNATYLRLSLVPLLWMIVPLFLTMAQLQSFYGYRAFRPGDTFLLKVVLPAGEPGGRNAPRPEVELRVPQGLRVETPNVWVRSLSEIAWRIRAEQPGRYALEVATGGQSCVKEVRVADELERISPARQAPSFTAQLLYPAERSLPGPVGIERIVVTCPTREISVFGWSLPWIVVFFVLVLVFALLLKSRFRVTF